MDNKDILDDSHFVDNLLIGQAIWSGKPNFAKAISKKEIISEIALFLIFSFVVIIAFNTTNFLIGEKPLIRFWVLLLTGVYLLYYFTQGWKWYKFLQEMKSTYIITESHIAQLEESGKLTYSHPLDRIYQVIIQDENQRFGKLCMMVKKKSPSKKKKISISQNMQYPDCSFKGLEDVREVGNLLVSIRNQAMPSIPEDEIND